MKQVCITSFFQNKSNIKPTISINTIPSIYLSPRKIQIPTKYTLFFDGCSKGNPGPAGAGAVLYHENTEIWSRSIFVGNNSTNNVAEYTGLIFGLQQAKIYNIKNLKVEGDSLLVINQMKGLYKCRAENLISLYLEAKELETYFDKIEYNHVLRNKNKRADELSNIAIEKYLLKKAI